MAAFEIIALDPVVPQLRAPGVGDTYELPRDLSMGGQLALSTVAAGGRGTTLWKGSTAIISFANTTAVVTSGLGFESGFNNGADAFIFRDGSANTLAQRNSTNAQTFRTYNTFTDASNYERGFMRWSSNFFQIGTEIAGTGSLRSTVIYARNTSRGLRIVNDAGGGADISVTSTGNDNLTLNFIHTTDTFGSGGTNVGYVGRISGAFGLFNGSGSVIMAVPSGATDRVGLFGTTSSFPAIKRSSAAMHIRLADDSAFAELVFKLPTANPGPGTLWNNGGVLTIGT